MRIEPFIDLNFCWARVCDPLRRRELQIPCPLVAVQSGDLPKRARRPPQVCHACVVEGPSIEQVHTDAFPTPQQITLTTIAVVHSPYKARTRKLRLGLVSGTLRLPTAAYRHQRGGRFGEPSM